MEEISGHGLLAMVGDVQVAVGNGRLMESQGIVMASSEEDGTIVYVAVNHKYVGYIVIADVLKEQSREAMEQLRNSTPPGKMVRLGSNWVLTLKNWDSHRSDAVLHMFIIILGAHDSKH